MLSARHLYCFKSLEKNQKSVIHMLLKIKTNPIKHYYIEQFVVIK